jgi:melibiose permease/lactose/raffinose/galactose permease
MAAGAALLLLSGLALPQDPWWLSFGVYAFANAFAVGGSVAFYQVIFIDIANTVEYNEWKTGRRSEGLIFSLRPVMVQMSSAVVQLIVMAVFLGLGITNINRDISDLENMAERMLISPEEKLSRIQGILDAVPGGKALALLACLALIPAAVALGGYWIYKKKFRLDESTYEGILRDLEARKARP